MRTIDEIMEDSLCGKEVAPEEALYCIAALDKLLSFARMDLSNIARKDPKFQWYFDEHFERVKRALNSDPKAWLGKNYDPKDPENQRRREVALKLVEKIVYKAK